MFIYKPSDATKNYVEVKFVWQISYPPVIGTRIQVCVVIDVLDFFSPFCFASVVYFNQRLGAGHSKRGSKCGFFLSVKFATSLLASLAGG